MSELLMAVGRSRLLFDSIRFLHSAGYRFAGILTDAAYEEYDVSAEDFRLLAAETGAAFFQQKRVTDENIMQLIREKSVKLCISVNWKYKFPSAFLNLFSHGILNFHLGNLPDYKGNATVNWSIINGEKQINANVHKADAELDAGDIVALESIPITEHCYIESILDKAVQIAPKLFQESILRTLENPAYFRLKNSIEGLRCYPRLPEDSEITWTHTASEIARLVRASSKPYQGAYSYLQGQKCVIWRASVNMEAPAILAMPGHVVEINRRTGNILVACGTGCITLEQIEYKSFLLPPAELINSIRARFKSSINA
jgi:methionyl-tRNA formyltransferase